MATSALTRVRRGANRAVYERETINDILDANLLCHVGFITGGQSRVIPTAYLRVGNSIYLHGNRRNAMLSALLDGQTACLSVTELNGLVLARSGMHSSANYRSVVLFAKAAPVIDKQPILDKFVDRLAPGRSKDIRPPTSNELNATLVVALPIDEASAKVRTGPPIDDEIDYDLPVWAGVLPVKTIIEAPQPCPRLPAGVALPGYITARCSLT